MKVSQLIEQLQYMPQDAEVHFEYGYGDHWRTTVAPEVRSVSEGQVTWSDYHRMPKVVEYNDDDAEETLQNVVLIG